MRLCDIALAWPRCRAEVKHILHVRKLFAHCAGTNAELWTWRLSCDTLLGRETPAGPAPGPLVSGGRIAQLVEQLTLNQRVTGSSPVAPTN